MPSYLFLWNPTKDTHSFRDYDRVQAMAKAGKPYDTGWICPSRQPRPGDVAFLQRTGPKSNGVFARGVVTRGAYESEDGVRIVRLRLEAFLPIGREVPRSSIIAHAKWRSPWMPMSSGNVIPDPIVRSIEALWAVAIRGDGESVLHPDEVATPSQFLEGATRQVSVNRYERNPYARQQCIEHYGCGCSVCGFDFEAVYGELGSGFIHVHHLKALAEIGREYEIDPVSDLRPICPNCHAMIHRREEMMTIEELRELIQTRVKTPNKGAAPNGGPATQFGNSSVTEGPPSVS
ncbi:MAG: HNH endonuclease [Chthoniobacterales bacterium]|nr:HNH endonuclease [Chthoniobacterales bacterium]